MSEQSVTFRIYFFARDPYRPKLDNLAMREALSDAFRAGVETAEGWYRADEGLSFAVADGVLPPTLSLLLEQEEPETEEDMETMNLNWRDHKWQVTLPKIHITFQQLAGSFIQRSTRGWRSSSCGMTRRVLQSFYRYGDATQVQEDEFTAEHQQYIKDALSSEPSSVGGQDGERGDPCRRTGHPDPGGADRVDHRLRRKEPGLDGSDQLDQGPGEGGEELEGSGLQRRRAGLHAPLVNFANEKVTFADERGEKTGEAYTPSLAGLLASCNVERGATYRLCANLTDAAVPEDPDSVVGAGKFILIRDDDEVRVGVDVDSLTTVDGKTRTQDMKVHRDGGGHGPMRDDIASTFRRDYRGQYKNSRSSQMLFIAAVNEYFRQLGEDKRTGPYDENRADVDTEAQRNVWIASGKVEAAEWTDDKVKASPFKRQVFLSGDVKILGSMTGSEFCRQSGISKGVCSHESRRAGFPRLAAEAYITASGTRGHQIETR